MKHIHFLATEEHYADHLIPLWEALPPERRGKFWTRQSMVQRLEDQGIPATLIQGPAAISHIVVASYADLKHGRRMAPIAARCMVQHGAGQSYFGVARSAGHPSYSGGRDHDDVGLFLVPNEFSEAAWRRTYPRKRIEIVGSPRVDTLPENRSLEVTVALSFHWQCGLVEETKNAFAHFKRALVEVPKWWATIGHCHPRARKQLEPYFKRAGIPLVPDFEDVCEQADVYVCDNSSTIFEFAATGRPVVLMNPPHYRADVDHGMRFWELATIGTDASDVEGLMPAIDRALEDPQDQREERERIVARVYPIRGNSASRAVHTLEDWADG